MKGIIMAGGKGTRLRPLTCNLPKPMLPVVNRPVIDYAIELLKTHGIHEIGVTLQYMPNVIINHIKEQKLDAAFEFFTETVPLGTAGSVKAAENFLSDTFVVLSGDGLCDIDITKAVRFHEENHADVTIVLKRVENPLEYGIVITEDSGKILRFAEKPNWREVFSDSVNTGIYIINKNVLEMIDSSKPSDFSGDLFPQMLEKNMALYGYVADGYWCDIGNLKSYVQANIDALNGKVNGNFHYDEYYEIKKDVWVGKYVKLDENAKIEGPCIIGKNSNIRANASIYPNTIIGNGCYIGRHATVKNSILHSNVYVGSSCELRGSIIADGTRLSDNVSVFEGSAIGSDCAIGENSVIRNKASLWPEKRISENCVVSDNIIWQTETHARIFDNECISGKVNVDITPDIATKIGTAFADINQKRIVIAHNGSADAKMIFSAIRAGAMAQGAKLLELSVSPLPTLRYAVRLFGADGGIYVGSKSGDISIFFTDEQGSNISSATERKLENAINSTASKLALAEDINEPQKFDRCCDFYERHLIHTVGKIGKNNTNFSVCAVIDNKIETNVLVSILSDLEINQTVYTKDEFESSKDNKFDLTVSLDDFGERLVIYNENHEPIDKNVTNLIMNYISLKQQTSDKYIIAPYNAPEAVDEIAKSNNGVVIRTKSGTRALINEIVKHDGIPDSLPVGKMSMYYDGIMFLLVLIDFLTSQQKSLKDIISTLPSIHLSEKEIDCPWDKRSSVMRKLAGGTNSVQPCDGIKITHKYGWSLVLPDSKRAVFKIYSEGFSEEYANELTDICAKKIAELRDE